MAYVYSLAVGATEEKHLFEGKMVAVNKCSANAKSICKKINEGEGRYVFTCLSEQDARKKCAEIGRSVCGTCVSHLYTSYQ